MTMTTRPADGLWHSNPALVQLLGLCPLLAVSNSLVNAAGMAVATLAVLMISSVLVALLRPLIPQAVRLPAFVLIIASTTTGIELLMQAYALPLYQALGIFIPLIVTNCLILGRAEAFAVRTTPAAALADALWMGLGFAAVLLVLGAVRELLGAGTLGDGLALLGLGSGLRLADSGFLPLLLPAGAFVSLGLLIAGRNALDEIWRRRKTPEIVPGARRVRVTSVDPG
ncbi:MAG: electron transport complex subunit E [Gammaproteobacteria bacterium AqS3]|nr:electron transport complex subunit E [Gammaproteobacteria bacterium AqS3]